VVLALVVVQIALGGWVSTNYAVLACQGFPTCNGQWWPSMDAAHGFTLLRHLGQTGQGGALPFDALVAIHMAHRLFAVVVVLALVALAVALNRSGDAAARRTMLALCALLAWQLASGLSNVVLGWPIVAALAHSAGAAGLVAVLVSLWARLRQAPGVTASATPAASGARRPPAGGPVTAGRPSAS
jgi:cytochrome c oxidase assembly protein subunit 15